MKLAKLLALTAAVVIAVGLGANALAFHAGGVAHCDGCHSMHQSADNPLGADHGGEGGLGAIGSDANADLLKGSDPTSTCLHCHAGEGSFHVYQTDATVINLTPGGSFFWLTQDFNVTLWPGNTVTFEGENTGHNVVAQDYSLAADSTNTNAPGGTFLSANLGCESCHDPHGQVRGGFDQNGGLAVVGSGSYGGTVSDTTTETLGNYRLLRDGSAVGNQAPFPATAPAAAADPNGEFTETDLSHVDYGLGFSDFCEACHPNFTGSNEMHPVDANLTADMVTLYNGYVATGEFNAAQAVPYKPLTPFARNLGVDANNQTTLDGTDTTGPTTSSKVFCGTCHRAHASAFQNATRWDMGEELLVNSHPTTSDIPGMKATDPYYGRTIATDFNVNQRSFCNVCHGWD